MNKTRIRTIALKIIKRIFSIKRSLLKHINSATERTTAEDYSNFYYYNEARAFLVEFERKKAAAQLERQRHSFL